MSAHFIIALILALFCGSQAIADDNEWLRFRGPNGTGVSNATNLPVEFGPEKNVSWKTALPPGHSSPALARARIYVTAHTPIDAKNKTVYQIFVIALDRKTGKELWRREIPRVHKGRLENVNGPASASPVTDGENVYAFFQDFVLIAFDANGKEKWRTPLGPFNIFYGYGASPILVDDKVILPVDQDLGSYLLAVDKNNGKIKWRVDRPEVISGYSTPTIYQPQRGAKQLIIPESFQLSAYSAADGKRVWWVRGLACEMKSVISYDSEYLYINGWGLPVNQPGKQIPTTPFEEGLKRYDKNEDGFVGRDEISGEEPIDRVLKPNYGFDAFDLDRDQKLNAKDWEIFRAMMASENGLLAIKLGGEGDMTEKAIRWKYQRPVPQVPSTLLYQGSLFMVNDSGILISFDPATGNVIKQGRLKGAIDKYFASPVGADGKVYLISQDGTVSVVKAAGDWDVLAVNALGDEVFATPAIADGKIYVRTKSALYCFGNSQTNSVSDPGGRNKPGFVYDSARKKFVLFGGAGRRGEGLKGDTWEWDGAKWTRVDVAGPSPRAAMGMAYDGKRRRVVLFGGFGANALLADTWEWDGKAWSQAPAAGPSARAGLQMVYDSRRQKVVLFGGSVQENQSPPGDTWEWDGAKWSQPPSSGPAPRINHSLAYDSRRGKTVLFGGNPPGQASGPFGDTWEWDGVKWTKIADSEPLKRDHHGMSYDCARGRVVLFGGSNGKFLGDTWEWDGAKWGEIQVTGPSARGGIPSMAYNTDRKKVVLFGGWDATGPVSDIWE